MDRTRIPNVEGCGQLLDLNESFTVPTFAPFRNDGDSEAPGVESRGQISHFFTFFVKIRKWVGEISEPLFRARLRTYILLYFDGGRRRFSEVGKIRGRVTKYNGQ